MEELILDTPEAPVIVITRVGGDLRLAGWDQNQIQASSDDDQSLSLKADGQSGNFTVSAEADCNLHVPRLASIRLLHVGGDAKLKNVDGSLEIKFAAGNLKLRQVGPTEAAKVGGDLSAKKIAGAMMFNAGGDAAVGDVSGELQGRAGGDLFVRDAGGGVRVSAGGDAQVGGNFTSGSVYEVKAGSDVICRVPPGVSARIAVRSGGDISVDALGARIEGEARNKIVTLGSGAAEVSLSGGGDVFISTQPVDPDNLGEIGNTFGRDFGVIADELASQFEQMERQINERLSQIEFNGVPGIQADKLSAHIRQEVERAMDQARRRSATLRTRVEARLDAAEQKAERQAEKQERQGDKRRKTNSFIFKFDPLGRPPAPPKTGVPPKAPGSTVSDEERMAVLKMLEQGKISVEQAEKLLAALEGAGK
jgi:hypothetical protein